MKLKYWAFLGLSFCLILVLWLWNFHHYNVFNDYTVGQKIDSLNGVYVYYNGRVDHVDGRNTTSDGYNLGLKYQCVEFVKRYYYEYLNHKMPDSYGHAKDFFDKSLKDGQKNKKRGLIQYSNPSKTKPKVNDLVIFDASKFNKYGHVAIVSNVNEHEIEIIQQNSGLLGNSRESFTLEHQKGKWNIKSKHLLGWLRKE